MQQTHSGNGDNVGGNKTVDKNVHNGGNNSGVINTGDHNTFNHYAQQHIIPKILTPSLGTHTHFIGRVAELQELQKRLNQSATLLLLNGIGGIGKSSLASYYLSTQKDNYDYYGWVETGENIKEAFISAFGASLSLNKEKPSMRALMKRLSNCVIWRVKSFWSLMI